MPRKKDIRKRWMKQLELYGLSDKDFDLMKSKLTVKFNKEPSNYDVIWGLFQELTIKTTNPQDLKGLYYEKAIFLHEEGRDCFNQLRESVRCELMDVKQQGLANKVEILSAGGCNACKKQSGLVFTINEALEKMPIPCKDCTFKLRKFYKKYFCRCEYIPIYPESL